MKLLSIPRSLRLALAAILAIVAATGSVTAVAISGSASPIRLLVANQEGATLSLVDIGTLRELAVVPTAKGPAAMVHAVDLGMIFVSHPELGKVSIFEDASLRLAKTLIVPGTPFGMAIDGLHRLWVTDWNSDRVSVINVQHGNILATLKVGRAPAGLAMFDGQVFVANRESDSVSVVDTKLIKVVASIPVGRAPFAVAADAERKRVLVVNVQSGTLSLIDAGTLAHRTVPTGGSMPYGVTSLPSGELIFVVNQQSGTLTALNVETLGVTKTIKVGSYPEGIAADPASKRAFVANWFSDDVSVLDLEAGKQIARIKVGKGPRAVLLGNFDWVER